MKKKLKIAVIGAGGIASLAHMPGYAKMDNVEIVAICDINRDKAEKLAREYYIPHVCENYKDVFEIPELDAVDICTPNYLHSVIAVEAMEHGFHVFCEKPDAVSVAEVMKMKDAAEKSGKVLMVMRNNRYMPISSFLKEYIEVVVWEKFMQLVVAGRDVEGFREKAAGLRQKLSPVEAR